jgi:hypothetical protein
MDLTIVKTESTPYIEVLQTLQAGIVPLIEAFSTANVTCEYTTGTSPCNACPFRYPNKCILDKLYNYADLTMSEIECEIEKIKQEEQKMKELPEPKLKESTPEEPAPKVEKSVSAIAKSRRSKLTFEKVIIKGVPRYKLIRIENVADYDSLPIKYVSSAPYYWIDRSDLCIRTERSLSNSYSIDSLYSEENVTNLIATMEECGNRLHLINKEIADLRKTWKGEINFII